MTTRLIHSLSRSGLVLCAILALSGCGSKPTTVVTTSAGTSAGGSSSGGSGSGGTTSGGTPSGSGGASSGGTSGGTTSTAPSIANSIYVVVSGVAEASDSPDSVFLFPQATTGFLDDEVQSWQLAGSRVSLDGAGNIYLLTDREIAVISPSSPYLLARSRSLPIGPGTKIPIVEDMVASSTGEIFVSDGKGIAVFSATATGDVDPVRYILGNSQTGGGSSMAIGPGLIAVDAADNLYVQNAADSSIVVFASTDTGTVVPSRTIAGPLTGFTSNGAHITGMTTDTSGNLYVLCQCSWPGSNGTDFGVLEFSPTANGDVAPLRFVTTPEMNSSYSGRGVAVDLAGTVYVSGGTGTGTKIFEFTPSASGSVTPSNTVTSRYGGSLSGIAVR